VGQPLSFQEAIMRLQTFWAEHGCIIWQPYYTQVGAGTGNPATFLRVLGPEPWNVAYVEPSIRPDDGRYGDNPNRMQMHYQFQVILKPDPGDPQGLYLQSLEAIGIDRRQHDIRFVEDNWESPALGAWGLGWEVWLDGQEITQFTYFQQAGGQALNPNSVEITYGLERIMIALQGVKSVWEIDWGNGFKYGDALLQSEIEHCRYYFEVANVDALRLIFDTYESESLNALAQTPPLVMPAYDYVLKCSHLFNVLDTRGAIGVVERAKYFKRMQTLAAKVATAYYEQREEMGFPTLPDEWGYLRETRGLIPRKPMPLPEQDSVPYPTKAAPFLLEIGVEELPTVDLNSALNQLKELAPAMLATARLDYQGLTVSGTPRRLVVSVDSLSHIQRSEEEIIKGPPTTIAYDADGKPTGAAVGFARKNGVGVDQLGKRTMDGGEYVIAVVKQGTKSAQGVLYQIIANILTQIHFDKTMRWNITGQTFSRPIRWIAAVHGDAIVPLDFPKFGAPRFTYGSRPAGSPKIEIKNRSTYFKAMQKQGIILDPAERRASIEQQIGALAKQTGGSLKVDQGLLDEVTNLVEQPTALLGHFEPEFLELPAPVLTTVMKKHQRYFAVEDRHGKLLPVFIAVRNGDDQHLDSVIDGNEHVIRARFADARFFYQQDTQKKLADFLPDLKTLTFQEKLGSYYDKSVRLEELAGRIGGLLGLADDDLDTTIRAARLAKADLATHMVVEMTSLQGIMGREYALRSGEPPAVAQAIAEHYQPRQTGDTLPESWPGIVVALADRLDSLVGLMAVGVGLTGSSDPYGLRRAAGNVVQILVGHHISIDLDQVVAWVASSQPITISESGQLMVSAFIVGRLMNFLEEQYRADVVHAVVPLGKNPYRASVHADQLANHVSRDDWSPILDAYARCVRITRDQKQAFKLKLDSFKEPVEKNLVAAYQQAAEALGDDPDVNAFVNAFQPLAAPIWAFFAPAAEGGVMVMDKDQAVRENRLALLQHIVTLGAGVADFSQLEGF